MSVKNYINLTNGIERIPDLEPGSFSFIRIQSTACEQKRWSDLILDLDYDFLMNLAIGNECIVYDYGTNKDKSRAVYQGLEFVKYVLVRCWFDKEIKPMISKVPTKVTNCQSYFRTVYDSLDHKAIKKIKYFRKFLMTDEIKLVSICESTSHDNDIDYYINIIKKEVVECNLRLRA